MAYTYDKLYPDEMRTFRTSTDQITLLDAARETALCAIQQHDFLTDATAKARTPVQFCEKFDALCQHDPEQAYGYALYTRLSYRKVTACALSSIPPAPPASR